MLSGSQKRKLKKMAELKQRDQLLTKSLETLEKHKIDDDVHAVLLSSQSIGKTETKLEKRRRAIKFSKAGLGDLESDRHCKRMKVDLCETDVKGSQLEVVADSTSDVVVSGDQGPVVQRCAGDGDNGGCDSSKVSKIVSNEDDTCKGRQSIAGNSSICHSPNNHRKAISAAGELNGESGVASARVTTVQYNSISRLPIPPSRVRVSRPTDLENSRNELPIIMWEQEIMEAINEHNNIIICGETGCGKTTQVPQFLYEAGYTEGDWGNGANMIGVTQPRRVAVLSAAKRVADELGPNHGNKVGFQVRHNNRIGKNCAIKFMTEGILLRELQGDVLLKNYSVIILDEAHERSLNIDILIGMLSRTVRLREALYQEQQRVGARASIELKDKVFPLKFILMSATMQVKDFISRKQIFPNPPPVIKIQTRQYTVENHFAEKTELVDYVGEAYRMVLEIHKSWPPGGILVFVTGQREVEDLCAKLCIASTQFEKNSCVTNTEHEIATETDRFSWCHEESDSEEPYCSDDSGIDNAESDSEDVAEQKNSEADNNNLAFSGRSLNIDMLKASFGALMDNTGSLSEVGGKSEYSMTPDVCSNKSFPSLTKKNKEKKGSVVGPLRVLPLYGRLREADQLRVLGKTEEGVRLVVVATNVAETSLTIPGINYVVDTGREKVKRYNPFNGMESYEIQWISKASATQRAGRAGRTGPGHCFYLYTQAAFGNEFPEFSCPEILNVPVDGVVLLLKSMGISKVGNFPFPTPPDASALKESERCLKALEALDCNSSPTPLGKIMAKFPISPRHSRLLLIAIQITKEEISSSIRANLVLGYAVAVSAALSLSNPFLFQFDGNQTNNTKGMEHQDEETGYSGNLENKNQKEKQMMNFFSEKRSDALTVAFALQCFEKSKNPAQFCDEHSLHLKTMEEMSNLRKQLLRLVFNQKYCDLQQLELSWTHGTMKDVEDNWTVYNTEKYPLSETEDNILCQAICAGWVDRVAKRDSRSSSAERVKNGIPYQAMTVKETVFLHPSSSIYKLAPDFLVYNEMLHTNQPYIHRATSVDSNWLLKYAGSSCAYSQPSDPFYDPQCDKVISNIIPHFGPHRWELPRCKVPVDDAQKRAAVFAYSLLKGHVLPCLKSVQDYLAAKPNSILKPEALGQKRVGNLLSKLNSHSRTVDNLAALREAWKENPQWLLPEIQDWFQDRFHGLFDKLWLGMISEALSEPEDPVVDRTKRRKKHLNKVDDLRVQLSGIEVRIGDIFYHGTETFGTSKR